MWALPHAVARSRGIDLSVVDYGTDNRQAKASGGSVTIEFDQVEAEQLWRVERIVVTATSTAQLAVSVFAGYASPSNLRDWTNMPAGYSAIAEYPQFLTIPPGQALTVVATGTAVGDVVTVHVQYQRVQRSEVSG